MIFIIGGSYQGKLEYALLQYQISDENVYDHYFPEGDSDEPIIINHFNQIISDYMEKEQDIIPDIQSLIHRYPNTIIISDEVGSGIVPATVSEIRYREQVGRVQVELASMATEVYQILCGLCRKLK